MGTKEKCPMIKVTKHMRWTRGMKGRFCIDSALIDENREEQEETKEVV